MCAIFGNRVAGGHSLKLKRYEALLYFPVSTKEAAKLV